MFSVPRLFPIVPPVLLGGSFIIRKFVSMAKPFIQLESVGKSFGDRTLYENLNLTVNEGERVALIAPNGAGKTTLLEIIAGKISPDRGTVTFRSELTIGYLPQNPELNGEDSVLDAVYRGESGTARLIREYESALARNDRESIGKLMTRIEEAGAWNYESRARAVLGKLNITDLRQKVATLSGGQLKRVALARVLIDDPQVLILDEPTNHLDLEMVEWLEDYLVKSNKTLLLITHDRYFLDRICTCIHEIDQKEIYSYAGGYSDYLIRREERIARFQTETDRARNFYRKELEWMRRMPQARGTKAKYRKDAFYETEEKAFRKRDEGNVSIKIESSRLGTKIFEMKEVSKKFGDLVILEKFSHAFSRGEKMAIIGSNGTGKTTFLNLLTGTLAPDSGSVDVGETVRFGYYRQEGMEFDEGMRVIDAATAIAETVEVGKGNRITASQFLNLFLFPPEAQRQYIRKLSGGEKRRLYLLTVLMRSPNFLILDEPTNDLDIMTLNVLEEYLANFDGCVIIVSHDRYFTDKVADHLLVFAGGGRVKRFAGNYTQYRNKQREMEEQTEIESPRKEPVAARQRTVRPPKMSFREKQEYERLESEITKLEKEKAEIENRLSEGNSSEEEVLRDSRRIGIVLEEIDKKTMRWLELSEIEESGI